MDGTSRRGAQSRKEDGCAMARGHKNGNMLYLVRWKVDCSGVEGFFDREAASRGLASRTEAILHFHRTSSQLARFLTS